MITKHELWENHNRKLMEYGETPITFKQWDIGYHATLYNLAKKEQYKKEEVHNYLKNSSDIAEIIRDFGGFYFSCYKNLLKLKLDRQYLFRFVYLCTYMNYDNKLEFGKSLGDNRLVSTKNLQEILKLSERECRYTKNELIKKGLITINTDKTITVNKKFAVKGDINKNKLRGSTRTMEQGIQELYNKSKATEHKKLGLLMELLPYVNFTHNMLCHNPEEADIKKIQAISLYELANMFNTNQTRMKNDLFKLRVNDEIVIGLFTKPTGIHIYINPRVYYKGNNINDLKSLINMFIVN